MGLWVFAGVLVGPDAWASGREKFQLKDPACPVKVTDGKTWNSVGSPWKQGETVLGVLAPNRPDVLYLFYHSRTYATPSVCWDGPGARQQKKTKLTQSIGLVYLNWQEKLGVDSVSGGSGFSIRSNQSGWGVSYSREFKAWERFRLGATAIAFSAGSTLRASQGTSVLPSCPECAAFGVMLVPELEWRRSGEGPGIGLGLPLAGRFTNWASSQGYVIQGTQRFLFGPMLSLKLLRSGWEFSSKLGFLNGTENLAWLLGLSLSN
ncbi:MAG: hypothetical protein ACK5QT_05385 [Oligoflexia bacterium]